MSRTLARQLAAELACWLPLHFYPMCFLPVLGCSCWKFLSFILLRFLLVGLHLALYSTVLGCEIHLLFPFAAVDRTILPHHPQRPLFLAWRNPWAPCHTSTGHRTARESARNLPSVFSAAVAASLVSQRHCHSCGVPCAFVLLLGVVSLGFVPLVVSGLHCALTMHVPECL